MNQDGNSNLYWWLCTVFCFIAGVWQANTHLDLKRENEGLKKVIAEQDKIIDEQQNKLNNFLNK